MTVSNAGDNAVRRPVDDRNAPLAVGDLDEIGQWVDGDVGRLQAHTDVGDHTLLHLVEHGDVVTNTVDHIDPCSAGIDRQGVRVTAHRHCCVDRVGGEIDDGESSVDTVGNKSQIATCVDAYLVGVMADRDRGRDDVALEVYRRQGVGVRIGDVQLFGRDRRLRVRAQRRL